MGRTAQENFFRRFGNPPELIVKFVPLDESGASEAEYRKQKIFEAYSEVLRSLLGRPPTEKEIFGFKDIRKEIAQS